MMMGPDPMTRTFLGLSIPRPLLHLLLNQLKVLSGYFPEALPEEAARGMALPELSRDKAQVRRHRPSRQGLLLWQDELSPPLKADGADLVRPYRSPLHEDAGAGHADGPEGLPPPDVVDNPVPGLHPDGPL